MYLNVEPYHGVLQQFEEILKQPNFFVRLTGMEGAGKTALLKELCKLGDSKNYATALFSVCPKSPAELRKLVRDRFSLPKSHNLHRKLEEHLRNSIDVSGGLVLFFDDAYSMSDETLQELAALTGVQLSDHRMLSVVLCADSELNERLKQNPVLRPLLQRFSHSISLPLLDRTSLPEFVHRCFAAQGKFDLEIEKPALRKILQISKGLPEVVVNICELLAVSRTGPAELAPITKTDVRTLASNFLPVARQTTFADYRVLAGGVAAVLVVLLIGVGWQVLREPTAPTPAVVSSSVFLDELTPTSAELPASEEVVPDQVAPDEVIPDEVIPDEVIPDEVVPAEIASVEIVSEAVLSTQPVPEIAEIILDEPPPREVVVETATAEAAEDPLELAVTAWINAWQDQDMANYFASYHTDFVPAGFVSMAAWQANRQRNIAEREAILITISDFRTVSVEADSAEVNFWLHYESPGYRDDTLKMLTLGRDGERWLISAEVNLEVRQL